MSTTITIQTLTSHTEEVTAVAFSSDTALLASGAWDTTLNIWDVATGTLKTTLSGHEKEVTAVAFSPDGHTLASGSWDRSVRLWDVDVGEPVPGRKLDGHEKEVSMVQFSPDGKLLASVSWNIIIIWSPSIGSVLHTLRAHERDIVTLAFAPDSQSLASTSEDSDLFLWTTSTGCKTHTIIKRDRYAVRSLAFSPDSQRVVCDSSAQIFDVETGEVSGQHNARKSAVGDVAFSPSGAEIATASGDGTIRIWDAASGKEVNVLQPCERGSQTVAFSPTGTLVVSVCWPESEMKVWDWRAGRAVGLFEPVAELGRSIVAFSSTTSSAVRGEGEVVWVATPAFNEIQLARLEVKGDG